MFNVLHLVTSPSRGGRELYCVTLIEEMQKKGVCCFIYGIKDSPVVQKLENAGIKSVHRTFGGRFSFKEALFLRKFLIENKINIIHSHTRLDITLGVLATIRTPIRHVYSIYMGVTKKTDIIHRFFHNNVDAFASSSEFSNKQIHENYSVPVNKIHLSRYGRVLSQFEIPNTTRETMREQLGLANDKIVAAVLSRIDPGKGILEFVESFVMLPEEVKNKVQYIIMGEPTIGSMTTAGKPIYEPKSIQLFEEIKRFILINGLEKEIMLLPFSSEYLKVLKMIDIFVLPSHDEMYSLSVIDAMLSCLPVIATDAGGTPEQIINRRRGLLIKPKSAIAIANAIKEFVIDRNLMKKCAEEALNWANNEHDMNKTLEKMIKLYHELTSK